MQLLVVVHRGEVRLDDLGARRLQVGAERGPQVHHAGARDDRQRAVGVGVDVDPWHREAEAGEGQVGQGGEGRRAHLRRLGDRNPRLRPPQIPARVGVVGDHHVQDAGEVGHRPGVGHHDVHRGDERPVAAHRDHAARRRVGDEGVVGGGSAPRRPGLFAEAERGEARRRGRARSVGGSGAEGGGEVVGAVGGLGPAVDPALHAAGGHGRHVRQAEDDGAGLAQTGDGERVVAGDEVGEGG